MRPLRPRTPRQSSALALLVGLIALILLGTVLLALPIATRHGDSAGLLTALFTATSAATVTGLVVQDTHDYWSPFGQVVILGLIQLGGLGYMTCSTLILVVMRRRVSLAQRTMTGELIGRMGNTTLNVVVRRIVLLTLAVQAVGVTVLSVLFVLHAGHLNPQEFWRALFTGISAFNNAGFDVQGGGRSLTGLAGNPLVLWSVALLALIGSTGFAVWWDVIASRRWSRMSLNTKVVLLTSGALIVAGAVAILGDAQAGGRATAGLSGGDTMMAAAAESVYARTSGFTAFDLAGARPETLLFIAGLMFIGGASASTAGGIKVGTFSVLFLAIVASIRGSDHVHAFGREIPWRQVNRALAVALLSVAIAFVGTYVLARTEDQDFIDILFEAVSAFATCGLSTGITSSLSEVGQLVIVVLMYVGRVGPLMLAVAVAERLARPDRIRYPEAPLNIG